VDAADGGVSEHVEGGGGEVEISEASAPSTPVGDSDGDGVAVVVGGQGLAADGVEVGVGSGSGEGVEESLRGSSDEVGIGVEDATSTETRSEEGTITGLDLSRNQGGQTQKNCGEGEHCRLSWLVGCLRKR